MSDTCDLQRFVEAQEPVYPRVVSELRAGRKQSHWMWFIFPQIAGLGHSAMAQRYAVSSRAEAVAYLVRDAVGEGMVPALGVGEASPCAPNRGGHRFFVYLILNFVYLVQSCVLCLKGRRERLPAPSSRFPPTSCGSR